MNSSIGYRQIPDGGSDAVETAGDATTGAVEYDEMDAALHNDDEAAADFLERLGDLDQFVAPAPGATRLFSGWPRNADTATDAPTPRGEDPAAEGAEDESDEAREFLERLGDLDRFISSDSALDRPPALGICPGCHRPVESWDSTAVQAARLLGAIEGREFAGIPSAFHGTCWGSGAEGFRRID